MECLSLLQIVIFTWASTLIYNVILYVFFLVIVFVLLIIGLILDYEFFEAKPPIVSLYLLLVWVSSEADLEISI